MTDHPPSKSRRRAGAFTLIELLVVVGIIGILASLLLPALVRTLRSASRSRMAAELNSIGVALEAYKQDFGDYPRPTAGEIGTGFAILGKALIGPAPADATGVTQPLPPHTSPYQAGTFEIAATVQYIAVANTTNGPPATPAEWARMNFTDGADGVGFRVGPMTVDPSNGTNYTRPAGKVHGPYLDSGKFKTQGLAILDGNGNPVMYFPANAQKLNLAATATTFYVSSASFVGPPNINPMMFNFDHNGPLATSMTPERDPQKTMARMQALLGDERNSGANYGGDGKIGAGEEPYFTGPFVLWSVGADGVFGPTADLTDPSVANDKRAWDKAIRNCDDVTNFIIPAK